MVTLTNPEQIGTAYQRWLRIDNSIYWAIAHQTKPFVEIHVNSNDDFNVDESGPMPVFTIPTSVTYPLGKMNAGVVLTPHTFEVLTRNLYPRIQEWLLEYLKEKFPHTPITKGLKWNSNDIYVYGKKVFGELSFTRAGITYYACMINTNLTEEDKKMIEQGLAQDKNFYADKINNITGLKNELPDLDIAKLLEDLEAYLFKLSGETAEYILV